MRIYAKGTFEVRIRNEWKKRFAILHERGLSVWRSENDFNQDKAPEDKVLRVLQKPYSVVPNQQEQLIDFETCNCNLYIRFNTKASMSIWFKAAEKLRKQYMLRKHTISTEALYALFEDPATTFELLEATIGHESKEIPISFTTCKHTSISSGGESPSKRLGMARSPRAGSSPRPAPHMR